MHVLKFIVANNILRLRTDAEMSREELGEKICYSEDYILKWERAESMPDDDAIAALAEAFGVDADYILNPHDEWVSKEEKEYLENASTLASSGETKNLRREEAAPEAPEAEAAAAEPYGRDIITPLSISIGAIITLVIILFMATGGRFGCASKLPESETEAHVHEYVRWEMVSYPDTYNTGEMRRYCNSCDDYIVRVLPESTEGLFYDDHGDGTCTVTGVGHGPEAPEDAFQTIVIPPYIAEMDGEGNTRDLRVVAIGEDFLGSFGDELRASVQGIVIPDTVTSIGGYAFIGTNISSITLPEGIVSIGEYAFAHCENLYEIYIPDSVESIGEGAFKGCTSLRSVYAQESAVWKVEPFTFQDCVSLEYANFSGITVVGESAFENCVNLQTINTESLCSIEKSAFKGCTSIGYIVFPKNLYYIGESAFEGCSSLLMIEFTENNDESADWLSIDRYAFKDCTALAKIWNTYEIPARVECIGEYAFEGCTALEFVKIQSKEVGAYAFSGCTAMYGVEFGAGTMYIGEYAFDGCSSIVQITLPTGMKRVDEGAFRNCTGLESFCANGSLELIGQEVFSGCEKLTTLDIYEMSEGGYYHEIFRGNKTITSVIVRTGNIPKNAFENCTSLESAVIGDGVSVIGEYAFAGCTELKSVLLHEGLTRINSYAFYECRALDMYMSGLPTSLTYIGKYAFARSGVTDFSTESKAYIDDYAFFESAIKSVTISCDSTKFGKYVFANCYDLSSITVEQGVTSIGMYMFSGCENYNLTSIELPESVTNIYVGAFEKCNWLRQVTIKSTNISVGDNTFYYCQHLETINFSGTTEAAWDGTGSLGNVLEKTEGIASSVTIVCSDDNIIISK